MKKTLSIKFGRSVSSTTSRPDSLEVVVTPLNSANNPTLNATYVAEKQVQKTLLANATNIVTFDLTPTYEAGLTEPIFYRLAWRKSFLGRISETDFSMPDHDVDFEDLGDLGNIIQGTNYLREDDLGVAGRVARLDSNGNLVDGNGNIVGATVLDGVNVLIAQEIRDRQSADAGVSRDLTLRLETQINSVLNTTAVNLASEVQGRNASVAAEALARSLADNVLGAQVNTLTSTTAQRFTDTNVVLAAHTSALALKADLVNGKVATSQIPALATGTAVAVADEAAMLALTPTQVQNGDLAVRPEGTWMLVGADPAVLANWIQTSNPAGGVQMVNGQVGIITLSAVDVGARSADVAVPMNDVNGLTAALALKATTTALATTNTGLAIQTGRIDALTTSLTTLDGVAVKLVGGVINTTYLAADVPRVDINNQFLRKDGTVIPIAGGGGGGDVTMVNGKTGNVVLQPSDIGARSASVPVPQADIDNLAATLSLKTDVATTQALATRVSRNEVDIADLQAGGGGTGGVSSKTTVSWVADAGTAPQNVLVKSPFGIAAGSPYYDPNGALEGEAAYPYIDSNGHLTLRQLDPLATPEPAPVNPTDFNTLTGRVTSLETGSAKPAGGWLKADLVQAVQDDLTSIEGATSSSTNNSIVVRNAAGTFAVTEPTATGHPSTKNYVDTALALKATTASVTALTTTVNGKALASDLTTLTGRVTNVENTMPTKADLDVSSHVPLGQIPTLPGSQVTGFSLKADLDGAGGKLLLTQVPTGIPQASISGLVASLTAKADLVGGLIPTAQIPALATQEVYPVANRAAMLALSTAQVQRGDMSVITSGADQGSYILNSSDPSQFANWVLLQTPAGSVQTVNGQSGTVVLGAADVGARPSATPIPESDITNLVTDLAAKSATTYVDAQVATRTTPAAVSTQIAAQGQSKFAADVVATGAVTLSGAQSIDGALRGAGIKALLTAQASSAQNGLWTIAAGAWTRATDQVSGSTFMPASLVMIKSGTANSNSIWQLTTVTSGSVDTNAQAWSKILQGGPPSVYTPGNGIDITGNVVSVKNGPGLIADGTNLRLDTTAVMRGIAVDVPAGSTTPTITHNLNTLNIWGFVREKSSGDIQLVGTTAVSVNSASMEFGAAPVDQQYSAIIFGW